LALAAKAYAFIKRRGYVIPEDVRAICHDVLRHRIGLSYEAEAENMTSEDIDYRDIKRGRGTVEHKPHPGPPQRGGREK
jgi:MoxR-like ATPase